MSELVDVDRQRERAAKNQSLFREVNERIEELVHSTTFIEFVCECANESCNELMPLMREEYEQIRASSNRFFVIPGHEVRVVEEILEANDRYCLVAKLGTGAPMAEHFDPRKRTADR
jgi:hypothetical protein